jgi:hypothetical protein
MNGALSVRTKTLSERSLPTSAATSHTHEIKAHDVRAQGFTHVEPEEHDMHDPQRVLQDKRGWTYFMQRNSVLRTYQKHLVFNSDLKVAALEFAIMLLSLAQLQWSYKAPYWVRSQTFSALAKGCN